MSNFYLGSTPRIVPEREILYCMYEDRYFLPGVIHGGEDYLIRVYLNDSHYESGDYSDESCDHAQFCVEYITADLIKEARTLDPSLGDKFYEKLFEAESFVCNNDGKSDFAGIIDVWSKALCLTRQELSDWADNPYTYEEKCVPQNKVVVDLGDGFSLVAERNLDLDYREICVYLKENATGIVHQDLAVVGESYDYDNIGVKHLHGSYSVRVYADETQEDWTNEFKIQRYEDK